MVNTQGQNSDHVACPFSISFLNNGFTP